MKKWPKGCGLAALVVVVILVGAAVIVAVRSDRAPGNRDGRPRECRCARRHRHAGTGNRHRAATALGFPRQRDPGRPAAQGSGQDLTGRVDDVRDADSGYYIDLGYEGDEWDFDQVHCQLRDPEQAVALRIGDAVAVRGRIAGLGLMDMRATVPYGPAVPQNDKGIGHAT